MTANRQQLQPNVRTLQNRTTAMAAIFMTFLLLCMEHVRAFANQYHVSAHDAMVLASAASSLSRKLSSATCRVSAHSFKKTLPKTHSFLVTPTKTSGGTAAEASSTSLKAWSIPMIALPNMPSISMPSSTDVPLHALGSWYCEVDPTTPAPIYDDEYENSYSFSSPTDDWPSMSSLEMEETNKAVRSHMRRGPLKAIRSVAGRFKDIIVQ